MLETGAFSSSPESGTSTTDKDKEKKTMTGDKKSTGRAVVRAELAAEARDEKPAKEASRAQTEDFWKQFTRKEAEKDAAFLGIPKPEAGADVKPASEAAQSPAELPAVAAETPTENNAEPAAAAEMTGSEAVEMTERAEQAEQPLSREQVAEVVDLHRQAADHEFHDLAPDLQHGGQGAEAAAQSALDREILGNLAADDNETFDRAAQAAEASVQDTIEQIESAQADARQAEVPAVETAPEPTVEHETEQDPNAFSPGPGNGNSSPNVPPVNPNSDPQVTPDASSGNPNNPFGPFGPGGPFGPNGPGNIIGVGGPGGGNPGGPGNPNSGGGNYWGNLGNPEGPAFGNAMPAAAPNVLKSSGLAERWAQAKGLLVGGVAGYFFGRHRGKKIGNRQAEKRFGPVKQGYERQIKSLEETLGYKEQKIRAAARDKAETLQRAEARAKLVETLLKPALGREGAVAEIYSRDAHEKAGAVKAAEFMISEKHVDTTGVVVPFNKKAVDYSRKELFGAAEKIKVDGASLKEMVEMGAISEIALTKVVQEFLDGGDVRRAVAREVREQELLYERDPKLRQAQALGKPAGATGGAGAGGLLSDLTASGTNADEQKSAGAYGAGTMGDAVQSPAPIVDDATRQAIRNRQMTRVGLFTALIAAVVAVMIVATG